MVAEPRRYHRRVTSEPEGKRAPAPEIRAAPTPSSVRELAQEALRLARVDLRQAEATAAAACDAAAKLDDPVASGFAFRCLANVRYLSGRLEEAVVLYQRALEAFALGDDEIEAAKTRSSALQALILLGRYDDAQSWAGAAREVFVRRRDPLLVARLDCNLGNLLHRLDRHREALAAYETSLRFFRAHGGDPQATAAALLNSAVCLIILGDLPEAEARFTEMSAHCRRHGMPLPALQAEYNLAYLHFHRGEYTRAIEHYRAAVERSREQGDAYHEALCRLDLAEIYLEVNLTAEAAELADQARAAFAGLKLRYEESKATAFAAIAAGQRGEHDAAAALFGEARGGFDAEGNHAWCAMVDFYRASVLLEAKRPEDARREATRARDWFLAAGQTPRVVLAELLLARAELAIGSHSEARRYAREAHRRLEQLDSPHLLYRASFVDGQIAEANGDRAAALERYRDACGVLGGLRAHLHSEELLIAFVKDKQAVFESLIWLTLETMEEGRAADALTWVENAKSRAFADMIAPRSIGPRRAGRAMSGLEAEVRLLREELNWCYSQLDAAELEGEGPSEGGGEALLGRGVATGSVHELQRRSRQLEEKLIKITSRLRSRDLDFDALDATGISIETVRAALPADTLLLEYYEARGTVFAFVVGRDRIEVRPVSSSERVRRLLGFLQFQLSKLQLGEAYVRTFGEALLVAARSHLRELNDELIAPLRSLLDARSLVVVPHGPLHRVPFQALWDGESYLVDHFALSYAPSASVFHLCSMRPSRARRWRPDPGGARRLQPRDRSRSRRGGLRDAGGARSPRRPGDGGRVAGAGCRRRVDPRRGARVLPARQPHVLGDPARGLQTDRARPLRARSRLRDGGPERVRHRPGRGRGRRRADRPGAGPPLRRGPGRGGDAVGRPGREHPAVHAGLLPAAPGPAGPGGRPAGGHGRAAGRLPPPLLLGPLLPGRPSVRPTPRMTRPFASGQGLR